MRKNIIRITSLLMMGCVIIGSVVGCGKDEKKTGKDVVPTVEAFESYDQDLDENGYYKDYADHKSELPKFENMEYTQEEVLEWGMNRMNNTEGSGFETTNDYVYAYANEVLTNLGYAAKESAQEGDKVTAQLEFIVDEKALEEFASTNTYVASKDGDAIVKSFIDKKINDEYEVEYTFPETEKDYAGKKATVKIVIKAINMADPIKEGVVEEHLEELQEMLKGIASTDTFLKALRSSLAKDTFDLFMEEQVRNLDVDVPSVFTDGEVGRLLFRLKQIGYEYAVYLEESGMTEADARLYCEMVARENFIAMMMFDDLEAEPLTDENLKTFYGEATESFKEAQGAPYMKLNMMRDISLSEICARARLVDDEGNILAGGTKAPTEETTKTEKTEDVESEEKNSDSTSEDVKDEAEKVDKEAAEKTEN